MLCSWQASLKRVTGRMFVCLLALVAIMALSPVVAYADSYSIERVDIDATVQADGSVQVLETREFDFNGDFHGVYWDIPIGTYEGRDVETTITQVGEMIDGAFVPFAQNSSGADHTYELIEGGTSVRVKLYSAHSDEPASFVIGFTDTNLAVRHDDVAVLYWKFVSDGWDEESKNVTCTVHLPVPTGKKVEPSENVRAWGHGPLDASVHFVGQDVVYEVPGVGTSEFAEARITFPAEWLGEAQSQGGTVLRDIIDEEQQWADEANARREAARRFMFGQIAIILLGSLASLIGSITLLVRYRKTHKPTFDDTYFRDVPSDDHPAVLGSLYRGGGTGGSDFTATLMRLTDLGAITLEQVTVTSKGLFGRTKTTDDYRLTLSPAAAGMALDEIDRRAIRTLFDNVGRYVKKQPDDDPDAKIVYFSQLERIAKKHAEKFHDAFEMWDARVRAQVAQRRFFKNAESSGRGLVGACLAVLVILLIMTVFFIFRTGALRIGLALLGLVFVSLVVCGVAVSSMRPISAEAIDLRAKLVALRRWLKDFTRLEEAVPRDVILWDRLLVMAVVLGVADDVIRQLKVSVPEILDDPAIANTYAWYYYTGTHGRAYESFNTNYSAAHSVSASKLAASEMSSGSGGGGGFSGGGGGGFGGGGGGGAF